MTWKLGDYGFVMSLSREVPSLIRSSIKEFVSHQLHITPSSQRLWVALHPGGPRIIDQVVEALGLQEWQVQFSRNILAERGNLSSATLPHIWERMLKSPEIRSGDQVLCLAFGPGLTVFGMVLEILL